MQFFASVRFSVNELSEYIKRGKLQSQYIQPIPIRTKKLFIYPSW